MTQSHREHRAEHSGQDADSRREAGQWQRVLYPFEVSQPVESDRRAAVLARMISLSHQAVAQLNAGARIVGWDAVDIHGLVSGGDGVEICVGLSEVTARPAALVISLRTCLDAEGLPSHGLTRVFAAGLRCVDASEGCAPGGSTLELPQSLRNHARQPSSPIQSREDGICELITASSEGVVAQVSGDADVLAAALGASMAHAELVTGKAWSPFSIRWMTSTSPMASLGESSVHAVFRDTGSEHLRSYDVEVIGPDGGVLCRLWGLTLTPQEGVTVAADSLSTWELTPPSDATVNPQRSVNVATCELAEPDTRRRVLAGLAALLKEKERLSPPGVSGGADTPFTLNILPGGRGESS